MTRKKFRVMFHSLDIGDYEVVVDDTQNLEYVMSLIKQAIQ